MIDSDGKTNNTGDSLIVQIRHPDFGLLKTFGYDVQLNTGEWVSGIKESDLKTYPKFSLACAMRGVSAVDWWYCGVFSALKRTTWHRMIARAIQRGQKAVQSA